MIMSKKQNTSDRDIERNSRKNLGPEDREAERLK